MAEADYAWKPGSFTKNFSWGKDTVGLIELYTVIREGFADRLEDVPRAVFRERIAESGRPDYIPMNFFLFNNTIDGEDYIVADELVFQALAWEHSPAFDRLALFAFLFSYAGRWKRAGGDQRRPALWANAYITERLAPVLRWNADLITADDIQTFVDGDPRYQAETSRKLATNLNYLLHIGRIQDFPDPNVSRWWVDCLFLALDRLVEDANIDSGTSVKRTGHQSLLMQSSFMALTGGKNLEKELAVKHLVRLYTALGGRNRLFEDIVVQKTKDELPGIYPVRPNDNRPRGAVHRTNAKILKSIPPMCADLARHAGFDVISPGEMDEMQLEEFVRLRTEAAIAVLKDRGIKPSMTIDELLKITRGE